MYTYRLVVAAIDNACMGWSTWSINIWHTIDTSAPAAVDNNAEFSVVVVIACKKLLLLIKLFVLHIVKIHALSQAACDTCSQTLLQCTSNVCIEIDLIHRLYFIKSFHFSL